jgi:hypothetical protein
MVVLDIKCKKCKDVCDSIHFQQNFKNWTSGNNEVDKFIQNTQLSVHNNISDALEWIPYERFYEIRYIAEDEFEVYIANWIDGNISNWDNNNQNWKRKNPNLFVVLKILNNLESITSEFINKVNKFAVIKVYFIIILYCTINIKSFLIAFRNKFIFTNI